MTTSIAVTPDQDAVQADVFIAAPPERVFQAMTDPHQLVRWWGQPGMYRVTTMHADLRVGGTWRSEGVGADGQSFYVEGKYREVDPPHFFVYTWRSSYSQGPETLVRVDIISEGNGTRVRVLHSGFAGDAEGAKSHGNGWIRVLGWMQAYVERNETVDQRAAIAPPVQ
jgi:uncharacterized protein YndB with AHSA1/START domain